MIRPVLRMGDARLLRRSREVESVHSEQIKALIQDLRDTMAAHHGAGLAAPQIGVGLRVVIFGIQHNPRYPEAEPVPETVLINPQLEALSEEQQEDWEGCLSVPGMRGKVSRYRQLRYRGIGEQGEVIDRQVTDFHARVVQHECDHLDGILYPMRMNDLSQFGFEDALFPRGIGG